MSKHARTEPALRLIVADESVVETTIAIGRTLPTLTDALEDADSDVEIPVPLPRRDVLRVIEWAEHHVDNPMQDVKEGIPDAFDQAFYVDAASDEFEAMLRAFKWFGAREPMRLLIANIMKRCENKTNEEICAIAGVPVQSAKEDRDYIIANEWVLEKL